jgi:hypothetical protein
MAVLSWAAEMAILYRPVLCPTASDVMAARWFENVRMGEFGACRSRPDGSFVNERMSTKDQTWTLASEEPDKMKLSLGSTTREVTGLRWDAVVATCRPVHVYNSLLLEFLGQLLLNDVV